MNRLRPVSILLLVITTLLARPVVAEDPPAANNLHLYLLIGQSNMAGGGPLSPKAVLTSGCWWGTRELELSCARAVRLTVDLAARTATWLLP